MSHEDDIRREIAAGRVTCLVGAGVSIAATWDPRRKPNFASWIGLLDHGARECVKLHPELAALT